MAVHKRVKIASGLAVPTAVPLSTIDSAQYDQAEHFKQRPRRHMMPPPSAPRRNWKRTLLMILIVLVAAYLIYKLLKGSKDNDSILPAFAKTGSSKVFYF